MKSVHRALLPLLALFLAGTAGVLQAGGISPELQAHLAGLSPRDTVPVIIRFASSVVLEPPPANRAELRRHRQELLVKLRQQAETAQVPLLSYLSQARIQSSRSLWISNSLAVQVPAWRVAEIAAQPGVDWVGLDSVVSLGSSEPAEISPVGWNLAVLHVPELREMGIDGQGVVVACLDTGVDGLHADLGPRYRGGTNSWFDPHNQHASPHDANGHGTQVMGLVLGGDASGTTIGVAPGARWIAAKIFADNGQASLSDIHLSFQWVLDPDGTVTTDDAPDIVNNSWDLLGSTNLCLDEFHADLAALRSAGIAVVFAAGNDGPGPETSLSPANDGSVFPVGSLTEGITVALSSSRGPSACTGLVYPDAVAPGVNVLTADLSFGGLFPRATTTVSGTSFAAPMVSGVLALLRGAFPEAGVESLLDVLRQSAEDLGTAGPDNDYGYGLIDALQAYVLLLNETQGADRDHDGYFTGSGSLADCNDSDASIHPNAAEVKHDGIDQDCNGWDLTIDILQAVYRPAKDTLSVSATSALLVSGAIKGSGLTLAGYGKMTRRVAKGQVWWEITVKRAGGDPGAVTVSGVEGAASAPTTTQTKR
jgi:bacillopeptidase F